MDEVEEVRNLKGKEKVMKKIENERYVRKKDVERFEKI